MKRFPLPRCASATAKFILVGCTKRLDSSQRTAPMWRNGRRNGLKIRWAVKGPCRFESGHRQVGCKCESPSRRLRWTDCRLRIATRGSSISDKINMSATTDRPLFVPVILGTPRKGRESANVARFVFEQTNKRAEVETEL